MQQHLQIFAYQIKTHFLSFKHTAGKILNLVWLIQDSETKYSCTLQVLELLFETKDEAF